MKEIEILVKVNEDFERAKAVLDQFEFVGEKRTVDTYFYDKLRNNLKPDNEMKLKECFRVREKDGVSYITYKVDNFDANGKWIYSDEYETKVESAEILKNIINHLQLDELIVIDNTKYTYLYQNYEIVLERVKDLGIFMEVEASLETEDCDVLAEKEKIQDFIDGLGIAVSEELNMGKPEMMLRKQFRQLI